MIEPEVTVVIPTRNRSALLLSNGLRSAVGQRGVEIEVVVVDDGSTDGTVGCVRAVGDPRVRVVRHDFPRGVATARNEGVKAARGPWTAFLDDDDLWSPDKLSAQLAELRRTDAVFAYSSAVVVGPDRMPQDVMAAPPAAEVAALLMRRNVVPAGASNVVASTELLRELGGFDDKLSYLADWDMWIRLAVAGRAASCDDVDIAYVRHPQRMSVSARSIVAELERLRGKHEDVGFRPERARLMSWMAAQHRSTGNRKGAIGYYARGAFKYGDRRQLSRAVATAVDWRGRGLRNLLMRRGDHASSSSSLPSWLVNRS